MVDVVVGLAAAAVPADAAGVARLNGRGDEEQWEVNDTHNIVVETFVSVRRHPPFEGEDQEDDFYQVEG